MKKGIGLFAVLVAIAQSSPRAHRRITRFSFGREGLQLQEHAQAPVRDAV